MMKAAVFCGTRDLQIQEYPLGKLNHGEVLLKVHACGVCGTDVHLINKAWNGVFLYGQLRHPPGVDHVVGGQQKTHFLAGRDQQRLIPLSFWGMNFPGKPVK